MFRHEPVVKMENLGNNYKHVKTVGKRRQLTTEMYSL